MKKWIGNILISLLMLLASLQIGAQTHYDTVNEGLQKIDPKLNIIDRRSSLQAVAQACNIQRTFIATELKRTRAGTEESERLQKRRADIIAACDVLQSQKNRTEYHKELDKASLGKASEQARQAKEAKEKEAVEKTQTKKTEETEKKEQESKIPKVQAGANHYQTVSEMLSKAGITPSSISRQTEQQVVSKACNDLNNYYINELRRAKAGSKDREMLLSNQGIIKSACSALDHPAKRKAYNEQLDKGSKEKAVQQVEEIKEKRELGERVKIAEAKVREKEQALVQVKKIKMTDTKQQEEAIARAEAELEYAKMVLEDVKAGRETKKPGEEDPNFIGKMKGFLAGEIEKQKKDADVKIFKLISPFLEKINIPSVAFKIFNTDLEMRDMKIVTTPRGPNIRMGIGITGITQVNNMSVQATIYIVQDTNKKAQYSLSVGLPDTYKISNLIPNFKALDALDLPKGKLVASSFAYTDPDGYSVENGLNFIASLSLTGPLEALGNLRKNASKYDFIVVDMAAPLYLQGVIASTTTGSFKAVVPMRLGIDFTKAKKIPSQFSQIINKITTDDFIIGVVVKPVEQTLNAQTGIQIILGTQQTPFRIQALGGIDALSGKINVAGKMPDMLEMKFIAIGDVSIEFYIDPAVEAVLAFFGVPVSGIALGGRIDLGKPGETRVSLSAKGKLSLETKKAADFVMEVEGKNIQFAEIVSLVTKMAEKAGIKGAEIPASKLPVMTISRVYGKMAPWDTEIAGEKISAGFQLMLDAQLFNTKFGLNVDIKHQDLMFAGSGYMSEITFKDKDKVIFKLSGPGPDRTYGTPDDGPIVACSFNGKKPLEGSFSVATMFDVPPLALKSKIDLEIANKAFKADFEFEYAGFTTVFGVNLDPAKLQDLLIRFGFKDNFQEFLSRQAKPALESLKQEAGKKLAEVDKKIGQLSGELEKLKQEQTKLKSAGTSATQAEINKTRATIGRIKSKIASLKRECDKAPLLKKTYICPKVGAQITAQGSALAAQETYLNTLLRPGKAVISGTMDALNAVNAATQKASTAISEAQVFRKTVEGTVTGLTKAIDGIGKVQIFKISEIVGEFGAKHGWLPKLLTLRAEVNIPGIPKVTLNLKDLLFDFKNPAKSALDIAKKLVEGVKVG